MKKGKYCFNDPTVRCKDYINTNCVNYTGGNLINIQVSTNDTLTDILISLDEIIENIDGGITSDEKVKVSFNDTVAGYLNGKLIEGVGISLIENNNGGNETFEIINTDPDQVVVLTEGTNITITGTYPNFTISASGSGSGDVTGGDNVGVGEGVFAQKTGSILEFKSLIEGVGISLSSDPDEITIVNSAPDQVVVLTESTGIDITGTYPNFTITNSAPDQTVILTEGSGIDVSGTYPNFTITHEDTSTVSNLDTSNAQVIDTLTFDTFGHVQTVTTRNLTLSDLGYTPVTDTNFGNTNITFTGNRTHTVGGFNTIFNNSGSWTWNLPANNTNVFDVYGAKGVFFEITGIDSGQSYYGYYDLWPTFNEISLTRGTGHTTIAQNPSTAGSSTVISSKVGSAGSFIGILNTEIYIDPRDGELTIYSLPNISTQDRLIGQYSSTEKIGYITLGTGLSLAAGVLSSTGSYTDEQAQDTIFGAIVDGTGISTSYNDVGNSFTITNSAPDQTVTLVAGGGIGISGFYPNFTIVNSDRGSTQNIFKNIAVSGQSTVIADDNDDILTLVAGTGVTITTDATTDSITINAGTSGTVNTGAALKAAYYPSAGTVVDDWIGVEFGNTNLNTKITAQTLTEVGLEIKAAASQSANLLNISSSAGTGNLISVDGSGNALFSARARFAGVVSGTAAGIDRIDIGTEGGTPRMYFEDAGAPIWAIDNNGGIFRWFTPGIVQFDVSTVAGSFANSLTIGQIQGGATSARQLHVIEDNATNTGVTILQRLTHTTSGTPGIGIGAGMEFVVETSAGNNEIGARIDAVTTNVTSTTEDFDIVFRTMTGGASVSESLRIKADGKLQIQSLANDNSETKLVVWNSTDKILEYRTAASISGGSSGYTVHSITNADHPYTIAETSGDIIILADSSGGAITVNVPTAVGNTAKYTIKLVTAGNTLTITPDGVETIDGSATAPISVANVALTFISDNANLYIM